VTVVTSTDSTGITDKFTESVTVTPFGGWNTYLSETTESGATYNWSELPFTDPSFIPTPYTTTSPEGG
jgi:hypothetical protein